MVPQCSPCECKLEASMHPQLSFIRDSHLHNMCQQICNSKSSHKHDFSSTFWQFFRWIWSSWPDWWTKTSNWWYWVVYMFRKPLELMKNEPTLMQKYSENLVRPLTFSASYNLVIFDQRWMKLGTHVLPEVLNQIISNLLAQPTKKASYRDFSKKN